MNADARRRQVEEPRRAAQQLQALAMPYRFRVQTDADGFPIIHGRYGQIEWYCDGVACSGCALPDQFALAVHTDHPRLFEKLWAIPGVKRHQTGDQEMRAVFPVEALEQVAAAIRARRQRTQTCPRSLQNLRSRVTSQLQAPRSGDREGHRSGTTERRP